MLMQRVITALILIPPVLAAVWFLSTQFVAIALATVLLVGAWEWSQLMGLGSKSLRVAYVGLTAMIFSLLYALRDISGLQHTMLWLAFFWWVLALCLVIRYPAGMSQAGSRPWLMAAIGWLLLGPAFLALVLLHARVQGPIWIFFMLVVIWAADTGAYFSGRSFGRHKLAVRVSPGKTWEGAVGGLVLSLLVSMLAGYWLFRLDDQLVAFIFLCLGVVVFSVVGDLTESMFKRQASVKDSGTLFPGHGGVLDRLDSLFAAAPLFVGGLLLLGI